MVKPRSQNSGFSADFQFFLTMTPNFRYMDKTTFTDLWIPVDSPLHVAKQLALSASVPFPDVCLLLFLLRATQRVDSVLNMNSTIHATKYKG